MDRTGFGGLLTDARWRRLLQEGRTRRFEEGAPIIRQGERESTVFLLAAGTVKVTMVRPDGSEVLISVRGAGEALGEMSALSGLPRTATVSASGGTCLTRVLTSAQFRLLVKSLDVERELWEHVVLRQTESDSLRAEMAALPARRRLAATLLRLATVMGSDTGPTPGTGGRGVTLRLGLSQRELGESIGLSRAAVAAEYNRLRALRTIDTGREYVVIHDIERLRALATGTDGSG